MPVILSALGSKLGAALAWGLCVLAGIALLRAEVQLWGANRTIARQEHSITQLQGAIALQNSQVDAWKAASDAATGKAQAALGAARTASARAAADVATILAQRAPADPAAACKAADDLILDSIK